MGIPVKDHFQRSDSDRRSIFVFLLRLSVKGLGYLTGGEGRVIDKDNVPLDPLHQKGNLGPTKTLNSHSDTLTISCPSFRDGKEEGLFLNHFNCSTQVKLVPQTGLVSPSLPVVLRTLFFFLVPSGSAQDLDPINIMSRVVI